MGPIRVIKDFDFMFKIVLVGDDGVGKTTLLRSFTESQFNTRVRPQDVADVETKIIQRRSKRVKLHVWDTAGMERYQSLTGSYYRNAYGCIIMFDISNEQSFHNANTWLADARHHCPAKTRMMLVATKCNEPRRREVARERAEALAREYDIPYMEVGAQKNLNVNELFETLSDAILADIKRVKLEKERQRSINLSMQSPVSYKANELLMSIKHEYLMHKQTCACG